MRSLFFRALSLDMPEQNEMDNEIFAHWVFSASQFAEGAFFHVRTD